MRSSEEQEDHERVEKAAEKAELENAYRELVKDVLSNTRIDPKYKGKEVEFFAPYEGEVTNEQVAALKQSNYAHSFARFVQLWKNLPEKNKPDLYEVTALFKALSSVTQSPYREIAHLEKDKGSLDQLDVLRKVRFLTTYSWSDRNAQFDVDALGEQLNSYLAVGMEWEFIDRTLLKMCIHRAVDEQRSKNKPVSKTMAESIFGKASVAGVLFEGLLRLVGALLPIVISFAINVAIVIWSLDHLSGDRWSIWAVVGLVYVAVTVASTAIYYGTTEMRHSLKKMIDPRWNPYDAPSVNADLRALDKAVNAYRNEHINLRLVREQLVRLQNTEVKIPVQLITLIDRSIAKGQHYWS